MPNPRIPTFLTECIIIAVFAMAIITPLLVPVWLFYMDAASHGYIPGFSSSDVIQQLFSVPR